MLLVLQPADGEFFPCATAAFAAAVAAVLTCKRGVLLHQPILNVL
jgi:hypothetical protein